MGEAAREHKCELPRCLDLVWVDVRLCLRNWQRASKLERKGSEVEVMIERKNKGDSVIMLIKAGQS